MKFSYSLFKKYLPKLESKDQLIEILEAHAFEAEEADKGLLDISIPTNRYSDAASHIGIIKELSALLDMKTKDLPELKLVDDIETPSEKVKVKIKNSKLCSRYLAGKIEGISVEESPEWIQDILRECGMRPINNIVDVMNYVMLEMGQPLHAFDADKIKGSIVVRGAKNGEKFISIDDEEYELKDSMLVIADDEKVLAIAGVKGGKSSEVDKNTKNIVVESANFDNLSVYRTSRDLGLVTDASIRFSHELSNVLAGIGFVRVIEVLREMGNGEFVGLYDSSPQKKKERIIDLDPDWLNGFLGTKLEEGDIKNRLSRFGFGVADNKVAIPDLRIDINTREDLAEEVIRSFGLNNLEPSSIKASLSPSMRDDIFKIKDKIRDLLEVFKYDEVYSHSFIGDDSDGAAIEVDNPISAEKKFLRRSLILQTLDNLKENKKFFNEVRLFEIGRVFEWEGNKVKERNMLSLGINKDKDNHFYELKGVIENLLKELGVVDINVEHDEDLGGFYLTVSGGGILGRVFAHSNNISVADLDLDLIIDLDKEEKKFKPIPKYPSVERDVSIVVDEGVRLGDMISKIKELNLVKEVSVVDEFLMEDKKSKSLTIRTIMRSDDKTLSNEEVEEVMDSVLKIFQDDSIEVR